MPFSFAALPIIKSILPQLQNQFVGGGLVLMFTGSIVAFCRNLPRTIWNAARRLVTYEIDISSKDPLFDYVTLWIDSQPKFRKAKSLKATTQSRMRAGNSGMTSAPAECGSSSDEDIRIKVFYSPAVGTTRFQYKGRRLEIARHQGNAPPMNNGKGELAAAATSFHMQDLETYTIRGYGRCSDLLRELVEEIVTFGSKPVEGIRVYYSGYGHWRSLGRIKPRPLSTVILPDGMTEALVADAREFLRARDWYVGLGIPWHHGYLFEGRPGNGKTSLAAALAGELHMDLYVLNIAGTGMCDEYLTNLMADVRFGSMVVLEDIDCTVPARDAAPTNKVTLSGLLNCLDGITSREGCIVVMTTNCRETLDGALVRPGRVDVEIHFDYATTSQKRRLCQVIGGTVDMDKDMTMAEVQQALLDQRGKSRTLQAAS